MKYIGSKRRIAKYIIPIMLKHMQEKSCWVEPFVGGANLIDKVPRGIEKIGGDKNKYLIALFKAIQKNWEPPRCVSRDRYYDVMKNKDKHPPELVGFVGFNCSFGGHFFQGYAKDSRGCNYADRGYRNLKKQSQFIDDVEFVCSDYRDLHIPKNSLIYCDAPYRVKRRYYRAKFDHDEYFEWCREKKREGHVVFVSEYDAPPDFTLVFEREQTTWVNKNKDKTFKAVERLFLV